MMATRQVAVFPVTSLAVKLTLKDCDSGMSSRKPGGETLRGSTSPELSVAYGMGNAAEV